MNDIKISVGQIMAELLCQDFTSKSYKLFSESWNDISIEERMFILESIKNYLISIVGLERVGD